MTKRWIVVLGVGLLAATMSVLSQQTSTPGSESSAPAAPALKDQKEKLSYSIGADIGRSIRKRDIDVDPAMVGKGIADAYSGGKLLMTDEEMGAVMTTAQEEIKKKQMALQAEKAQAAKKEGESFLAANKAKEGVVTLPTGLQYKVLQAGTGPKPTADDSVVCQYRGSFIDGTEFDSSYKRNQPATFPVKGVIKGWTDALQLMPVGSKWQLFVPSDLAYGESGRGPIPPNSALIFEVELVSIKEKAAAEAKPAPEKPAQEKPAQAKSAPEKPTQPKPAQAKPAPEKPKTP